MIGSRIIRCFSSNLMMKRSVLSSPSFFLSFRGITITFELSVWYAFAVVIIISAISKYTSIFGKLDILKVRLGVLRLGE